MHRNSVSMQSTIHLWSHNLSYPIVKSVISKCVNLKVLIHQVALLLVLAVGLTSTSIAQTIEASEQNSKPALKKQEYKKFLLFHTRMKRMEELSKNPHLSLSDHWRQLILV